MKAVIVILVILAILVIADIISNFILLEECNNIREQVESAHTKIEFAIDRMHESQAELQAAAHRFDEHSA